MRKIQTQCVHHITLGGADRQSSINFWEGVLEVPFVFEQPNHDSSEESHPYFDPGEPHGGRPMFNAPPDAVRQRIDAAPWPALCRPKVKAS